MLVLTVLFTSLAYLGCESQIHAQDKDPIVGTWTSQNTITENDRSFRLSLDGYELHELTFRSDESYEEMTSILDESGKWIGYWFFATGSFSINTYKSVNDLGDVLSITILGAGGSGSSPPLAEKPDLEDLAYPTTSHYQYAIDSDNLTFNRIYTEDVLKYKRQGD